jgi:hypothetical protein
MLDRVLDLNGFDILCRAGGCYNGLVAVFDIKKPRAIAIQVSRFD